MDWSSIISLVTALLATGGVIYLIVQKLFERKRDSADTQTVQIHNGNDVADLYNKIDEIVERKTAPITSELNDVKGQLEEIKSTWCCYKDGCLERILYKRRVKTVCELSEEAKGYSCQSEE